LAENVPLGAGALSLPAQAPKIDMDAIHAAAKPPQQLH
jgi:hypothetical protein